VNPNNVLAELKRRNVYRVGVAYCVVGWLVVEVATQGFQFFEVPNWGMRLVDLLVIVGLPISLVISWAFELTPEGVKRTEEVSPGDRKRAKSQTWIYVAVIAALALLGRGFLLGDESLGLLLPRAEQHEQRRDDPARDHEDESGIKRTATLTQIADDFRTDGSTDTGRTIDEPDRGSCG
jgi:hypothetical protein